MVSIIILNYNGNAFLRGCLDSVLLQSYKDFEIIVVDNASQDGSLATLEDYKNKIKLIPLKKNLGFAGGNNVGYENAEGELVVLLNNDTIVDKDWLIGLVEAVMPGDVAIASSLVVTEGIPEKYYEMNGSLNFWGHNIMRVFVSPNDIFYCGGCSLIYKSSILGKPFDEDYFAYSEDVYLSLRARYLGYKVVHTNNSYVHHFGGGSFKKEKNDFVTYLQERNRLLNTCLFFSTLTLVKLSPYLVVNFLVKAVLSIVGSKYSLKGILKAYGYLVGNCKDIYYKRKKLHIDFKKEDRDIIRYMTSKILNEESKVATFINRLSLVYCRIVRLKTIEFYL